VLVIAIGFLTNEYVFLGSEANPGFLDIAVVIGILCAILSGIALLTALPSSIRVRFQRIRRPVQSSPAYGFGSMVAVGLGATLGSPLFILIPLNIVQYEFVSLGSLLLATVLSVLMAKVYADMYTESIANGLDAVGGPSFTKAATGTRSVRYFVSRLSMWIANTALAAYSKIVFVVFDFELMPGILNAFGIYGLLNEFIVWLIAGVFIAWTILNALFERRFLKSIGFLQIILTSVMMVILVYQIGFFGHEGSWNLTGIGHFTGGGNWVAALVINTGYLYLLFFGFQEIQALERDAKETSSIPVISWIKKGYRMDKSQYLGLAMIASVVIAATVNIMYGLSVFSLHPDLTQLTNAQIPALFISGNFSPIQELLTAIAFLIATITTFVPAFLAASRHLSALSEDGFMPQSVAGLSWVFTIVTIFILAVGNENFLINITDFLVLISLGIISFSAIWLRRRGFSTVGSSEILPLVVGVSCFVAGAAIYFVSESVAIFGAVSIAIAYLIYDIYELGSLGSQLFLGVFDAIAYVLLVTYPHPFQTQSYFLFQWLNVSASDTSMLSIFLILSSLFLFANLTIELYVRSLARKPVTLRVGGTRF